MLYYLLCAVRSSLMAVIIDTNALTRETNALWLELDEELRLHNRFMPQSRFCEKITAF